MKHILASTFHASQSQGTGWSKQIDLAKSILHSLYDSIVISATEPTVDITLPSEGTTLIEYINSSGMKCVSSGGSLGDNHRHSLSMSLSEMDETSEYRVHYCDFDRILLWAIKYPNELRATLKTAEGVEVLFPYRRGIWQENVPKASNETPNAWTSHPITQRSTEIVITYAIYQAIAKITARTGSYLQPDPLGTSQITSQHLTKEILKNSKYIGFPQAEWLPIIIGAIDSKGFAQTIKCVPVDGLEFETLLIQQYSHDESVSFEKLYKVQFDEIEGSSEEAQKRIEVALSMMDSFLYSMAAYGLASRVEEIFQEYICDLEDLSQEISNESSNSKSILEAHLRDFQIRFLK